MSNAVRAAALGQLLTKQQLKEVGRILKSSKDTVERCQRLKDYYQTFSEELLAKGVLPDYLAYATEWAYQKTKGTQ